MKMIKKLMVFLVISSFFLVAQAYAGEKSILFHAGLGQRGALNEIKAVFEKRHPDIKVNFSYKGSGYFIADITRSRQGDLFMPGEEFYLMQAQNGYPRLFCYRDYHSQGEPKEHKKNRGFRQA
jgi:molybdate transport system substrate-binding protein